MALAVGAVHRRELGCWVPQFALLLVNAIGHGEATPPGCTGPKAAVLVQQGHAATDHTLMQVARNSLEARSSTSRSQDIARTGLIENVGGVCLRAKERKTNGGKVEMDDCDYSDYGQLWTYDDRTGRIKNEHGICLDASQRDVNGGKVHTWECEDGHPNQQWHYDADTGKIRNRHGVCLDSAGQGLLGLEAHMWKCIPGERNQRWQFVGSADLPDAVCHTAQPGEDCHAAVVWAKNKGMVSNPEWYPGLNSGSSFDAIQAFLHKTGASGGACRTPPCQVGAVGQSACESALDATAEDQWSTGTCRSRISDYHSSHAGSSDIDAMAQVALMFSACESCWPWAKYKASGETYVSTKRGIAIQNARLSKDALVRLATVVSWGKIWDWLPGNEGGSDFAAWAAAGVGFIPMVWGAQQLQRAENGNLPVGSAALLGFNEPNFREQADLSPEQAALLWPRMELLAKQAGIDTLVSPAMGFSNRRDPIRWLRDFFRACAGCKVDAVAFHSYTCYGRWLKEHLDRFRVFGKPIWLTEFACSEASSPERLSASGQMAYMKEAIPLLEHDSDVQKYAWFSYFEDEWAFPIVHGRNGDAGLVHGDGTLSELGELYASFASSAPLERIQLRSQDGSSQDRSCHTAARGEACYSAVTWAKDIGIASNPSWYPGLSSSSRFEEFQEFLHATKANSGVCASRPC